MVYYICRRRNVFESGGGQAPRGLKPNLPPKSNFSSDFGHFVFANMLRGKKKIETKTKTKLVKISGRLPSINSN